MNSQTFLTPDFDKCAVMPPETETPTRHQTCLKPEDFFKMRSATDMTARSVNAAQKICCLPSLKYDLHKSDDLT